MSCTGPSGARWSLERHSLSHSQSPALFVAQRQHVFMLAFLSPLTHSSLLQKSMRVPLASPTVHGGDSNHRRLYFSCHNAHSQTLTFSSICFISPRSWQILSMPSPSTWLMKLYVSNGDVILSRKPVDGCWVKGLRGCWRPETYYHSNHITQASSSLWIKRPSHLGPSQILKNLHLHFEIRSGDSGHLN